jgi:hypothetical protein
MEFYRPLNGTVPRIRVHKCDQRDGRIERAIRLYCTQHGQAWNLQIRSPLGIGYAGMTDGKDDVIANANLYREDLLALRAAIDEALA